MNDFETDSFVANEHVLPELTTFVALSHEVGEWLYLTKPFEKRTIPDEYMKSARTYRRSKTMRAKTDIEDQEATLLRAGLRAQVTRCSKFECSPVSLCFGLFLGHAKGTNCGSPET